MRFDVHVMEICGDLRHTFHSHCMETRILRMQLFYQGGGQPKSSCSLNNSLDKKVEYLSLVVVGPLGSGFCFCEGMCLLIKQNAFGLHFGFEFQFGFE